MRTTHQEPTYVDCDGDRGIYAKPLNSEQAADYLGVSVKQLLRLVHSGVVPAKKVGNTWRYSQRKLAEFVGETD